MKNRGSEEEETLETVIVLYWCIYYV